WWGTEEMGGGSRKAGTQRGPDGAAAPGIQRFGAVPKRVPVPGTGQASGGASSKENCSGRVRNADGGTVATFARNAGQAATRVPGERGHVNTPAAPSRRSPGS